MNDAQRPDFDLTWWYSVVVGRYDRVGSAPITSDSLHEAAVVIMAPNKRESDVEATFPFSGLRSGREVQWLRNN